MDLQELFIQFAAEFVKRTKGEDVEATEEDVNSLIEMLGPDQDTIEQNLTAYSEDPEGFLETFIESTETYKPTEEDEIEFAAKGKKLNKLNKFKKEAKRCAWGCKMVKFKGVGGKISDKCACGCKTKK